MKRLKRTFTFNSMCVIFSLEIIEYNLLPQKLFISKEKISKTLKNIKYNTKFEKWVNIL